jgi:AcrR family transcriptional regulator
MVSDHRPGSLRQEPAQPGLDERQRILRASWRVLQRSGFDGLKVQLVAREAGISARTFYRHFPDKDALIFQLVRDEMARSALLLESVLGGLQDPVDRVTAWIRVMIEAAGDPRRAPRARLFSTQQHVLLRYPREFGEDVALLVRSLRSALEEGLETGQFPWADADRDPLLIYRVTAGSMTGALGELPDRGIAQVIDDTVGFALRALGMPRSPRG